MSTILFHAQFMRAIPDRTRIGLRIITTLLGVGSRAASGQSPSKQSKKGACDVVRGWSLMPTLISG
jgi:hypothetical protein